MAFLRFITATVVGGGVGYVTLCSIKPDESELIKVTFLNLKILIFSKIIIFNIL
jgi:hypothetical protein